SRNSPRGLRNGTRSHWKWKRASSRPTSIVTTVSIRNNAICVNTALVLPELVAHLGAAPGGRRQGFGKTLGEPLAFEHFERSLGRAALGGHVFSELRGGFMALRRERSRAEHAMLGEPQGVLARNAALLGERGELLDEPEHVRRAA